MYEIEFESFSKGHTSLNMRYRLAKDALTLWCRFKTNGVHCDMEPIVLDLDRTGRDDMVEIILDLIDKHDHYNNDVDYNEVDKWWSGVEGERVIQKTRQIVNEWWEV